MTGISVRVDDAEITAALRRLQERCGNLQKPLAEIGQTLVTLTDLSFKNQRDPWGNAWTKLAASTLRQRRGTTAAILRDTGRLASSISSRADQDSVTIGTNVVYAAIHQFGGDIQRAARTATLYFKQGRDGTVGNRFVRRGRSNFAQDVEIGAHAQHIPERSSLPIRPSGEVDLPAATIDANVAILRRHLGLAQ